MFLLSDKQTLHVLSCLFPLISFKHIPSPLSLHHGLLLASLSDSVHVRLKLRWAVPSQADRLQRLLGTYPSYGNPLELQGFLVYLAPLDRMDCQDFLAPKENPVSQGPRGSLE